MPPRASHPRPKRSYCSIWVLELLRLYFKFHSIIDEELFIGKNSSRGDERADAEDELITAAYPTTETRPFED